jgi:hypothetical protein
MRAGSVLLAVAVLALLLVVGVSADAAAQREKIAKVSLASPVGAHHRPSASRACPVSWLGRLHTWLNCYAADSQRGSGVLNCWVRCSHSRGRTE